MRHCSIRQYIQWTRTTATLKETSKGKEIDYRGQGCCSQMYSRDTVRIHDKTGGGVSPKRELYPDPVRARGEGLFVTNLLLNKIRRTGSCLSTGSNSDNCETSPWRLSGNNLSSLGNRAPQRETGEPIWRHGDKQGSGASWGSMVWSVEIWRYNTVQLAVYVVLVVDNVG